MKKFSVMILCALIITLSTVQSPGESRSYFPLDSTHLKQIYEHLQLDGDNVSLSNMIASAGFPPILRQSTGQIYTILLGDKLDYREADTRKQELDRLGFFPVEIIPDGDGTHSLVVGRFPSSDEASEEIDNLLREGFFWGEIIPLTEAGLTREEEELFMQITPDEAETRDIYRIFIGSFRDQSDAVDHRTMIEMEGYYPVEVVREDNEWKVFLGRYESESLAREVERSLRDEGYLVAELRQITEEVSIPTPRERLVRAREAEDIEREIERARQIGDSVLYVQQLERLLHTSLEQDRVIEELRKAVQLLDQTQRERLIEERRREEQERLRQANIRELHRQAFRLLEQREPHQALSLWEEILDIDPNNSQALMYMQMAREQIRDLRDREERDQEQAKVQEEIDRLVRQGSEYLRQDNLEEAELTFRRVLSLDSENIEARQALQQITARSISQRGGFDFSERLAHILVASLFAIIIAIFIFLFLRYRQISERDRKLLEQVQQLSYNPPLNDQEGATLPGNSPATQEIVHEPATEPTVTEKPPEEVSEEEQEEFITLEEKSQVSEEPSQKEETPSSEKEEKEIISSETERKVKPVEKEKEPDLQEPEHKPEENITDEKEEEKTDSTFEEIEEEVLSISPDEGSDEDEIKEDETLLGPLEEKEEKKEPKDEKSLADEKSEEQLQEFFQPGSKEKEDISGEVPDKPEETPVVSEEESEKQQDDIIFAQDFESEEAGKLPDNWEGSYDYASLKVVENVECLSGKKCIQYEKNEPKGTAYFYRNTDDLQGSFAIEFDFRCDRKNKYLLGVYLEKDKDFRQSIHTILYMVNPSDPKLRIHGESVPYELSTWKKIRYEIDLENKTLNGYVDGQLVLKNSGLPDNLDYINTISIRDNLGTTALMYLNNFKVIRI